MQHVSRKFRQLLVCFAVGMVLPSAGPAWAIGVPPRANAPVAQANSLPEQLEGIGITEKLGNSVSLHSLRFRDEAGQEVALGQYFSQHRPVILTLVYYQCPNLCNFLLNGFTDSLKKLKWSVGDQFDIVTVSIDPHETPELGRRKKAAYVHEYGRPSAERGWHFLTGDEAQIRKLAGEVGFGYRYVEAEKQFAHAAAIFVLTPEGKVSRYLYGIDFKERDLKLSLLEASDGKIGTVLDRILMYCYRYNPTTRKYSVYLTQLMQGGGAVTLLLFGGYLTLFWRRQRNEALMPPPGVDGENQSEA
jgi:protein SCO1/2